MEREALDNLQVGDLIRHASDGQAYVVMGNFGNHVTAARVMDVTNPDEWEVVSTADHTLRAFEKMRRSLQAAASNPDGTST
jgi:major membrane immunogen (membrane-anchored lipoprotein)